MDLFEPLACSRDEYKKSSQTQWYKLGEFFALGAAVSVAHSHGRSRTVLVRGVHGWAVGCEETIQLDRADYIACSIASVGDSLPYQTSARPFQSPTCEIEIRPHASRMKGVEGASGRLRSRAGSWAWNEGVTKKTRTIMMVRVHGSAGGLGNDWSSTASEEESLRVGHN